MENFEIYRNPSDFYINVSESLSPNERLTIINNLTNRSCETCTNGCCSVPTYEKVGLDENGKAQGHACIGWYNDEIIGRSKMLCETDVYKLTLGRKK